MVIQWVRQLNREPREIPMQRVYHFIPEMQRQKSMSQQIVIETELYELCVPYNVTSLHYQKITLNATIVV